MKTMSIILSMLSDNEAQTNQGPAVGRWCCGAKIAVFMFCGYEEDIFNFTIEQQCIGMKEVFLQEDCEGIVYLLSCKDCSEQPLPEILQSIAVRKLEYTHPTKNGRIDSSAQWLSYTPIFLWPKYCDLFLSTVTVLIFWKQHHLKTV